MFAVANPALYINESLSSPIALGTHQIDTPSRVGFRHQLRLDENSIECGRSADGPGGAGGDCRKGTVGGRGKYRGVDYKLNFQFRTDLASNQKVSSKSLIFF